MSKISIYGIQNHQAKTKARRLLKSGLTQKETGKRVGISEKTIGKWVKKYKWNEETIFLDTDAFLKWLKYNIDPESCEMINSLILKFNQRMNIET